MKSVQLRAKWIERILRSVLFTSTLVPIFVTVLVLCTLVYQSLVFFEQVPIVRFFAEKQWEPLIEPRHFGVAPIVIGSFLILILSLLFALPIALLSSIFISEYAPSRVRNILKPLLELLAGIPTVVFGFFALTTITPFLKQYIPEIEVFNALSASIVVAIMVLPMLISLFDDAFASIPKHLRDSAYGLGATPYEVMWGVLIPAVKGRMTAAILLAASRALGETMAVTLAAGSTPRFSFDPLQSIQTMTAYIVQVSLGDMPAGGIESLTTYAVATLLFVICFVLNSFGGKLMKGDTVRSV